MKNITDDRIAESIVKTQPNVFKEKINFERAFRESGIPFQQWCVAYVKERVRALKVIYEEYPLSAADKDTRVDFVAAYQDRYNLVVECKQCNPEYKAWLFPRSNKDQFAKPEVYCVEKQAHNPTLSELSNQAKIVRRSTNFYTHLSSYESLYPFEAKIPKKANDKNFDIESIQNAAYQASQSCIGLMKEKWDYLTRESPGSFNYYPVIITTAELYYMKHDPLQYDHFEEKLPTDKFRPVDIALYHYPVSDSLWAFHIKRAFGDKGNPHKRLPILIVNYKKIGEFFDLFQRGVD